MKVLSLFTGAGGLDLGLERAGLEVAGCVEQDDDCRATLRKNRPDWAQVDPGNIHAHRPSDLLASFKVGRGDITLLAGGAPCQPFSKSARWKNGQTRRMGDPRARTVRAYLDILEATLPEAMLLENVRGLIATRKHVTHRYEGLDVLRSGLERINKRHKTSYELLPLEFDAADYGVPQHRHRVFLYAAREGSGLTLPVPTHGPCAPAPAKPRRHTNSWDALWDLDDPEFDDRWLPRGKWGKLLPSIPEGSNYLHHTARGEGEPIFGWRRRYWSFLLKLAKALPSWTVQAQAGPATGPFHWRSRRLTPREMARLQCFPDSWGIVGAEASAFSQLGNAVPPPISEMLGVEIRRQLLGQSPRRKPSLTPTQRLDLPDPEPTSPVPEAYLELRGLQEDHPGEGLGPGALKARAEASQ